MQRVTWIPLFVLSFSVALSGYFIGNMHKTADAHRRYVEVKGLSEREVDADLAVWPLQITVTGNDLYVLNRKLEAQKQSAHRFFDKMGFAEKEMSIGITHIEDNRARPGSFNSFFRYVARADITLRTDDIEKIKKSLSQSLKLISEGILLSAKNNWRPITYIYTGLNAIKPAMVEEATQNAKEVAEKFAQDSGSKVGKIRRARQGLFSIANRDENTPEVKVVRVVSTIEYLLED